MLAGHRIQDRSGPGIGDWVLPPGCRVAGSLGEAQGTEANCMIPPFTNVFSEATLPWWLAGAILLGFFIYEYTRRGH
ncbi:MAG: hypothetical protein GY906_29255 [bacterium]|nr:hypothetical protein [bacterium]